MTNDGLGLWRAGGCLSLQVCVRGAPPLRAIVLAWAHLEGAVWR